jgi:alpha-methylacyl-CoA racemase
MPLTGVRVLDLSRLVPGPFATMILAGLGAEIVRVEDLDGGD